jgi:two-component system, NarL family, invasion response regulator UvrY
MSTPHPPSAAPAIDIAVVAASPLMLGGLASVLDGRDEFRVTHQVTVITALPQRMPSAVVVVDLHGIRIDAAKYWTLAPRGTPIVALGSPDKPPRLFSAVQGGVHAVISRQAGTADLLLAVRTAHAGGLYIGPELLIGMVAASAAGSESQRHELTDREAEALRYLAEGLTHEQIGRRMGLAETTISTYIKRIRHKLQAGNKAELTRRAIELGFVEPRL